MVIVFKAIIFKCWYLIISDSTILRSYLRFIIHLLNYSTKRASSKIKTIRFTVKHFDLIFISNVPNYIIKANQFVIDSAKAAYPVMVENFIKELGLVK